VFCKDGALCGIVESVPVFVIPEDWELRWVLFDASFEIVNGISRTLRGWCPVPPVGLVGGATCPVRTSIKSGDAR
jgi:hypothetical protein